MIMKKIIPIISVLVFCTLFFGMKYTQAQGLKNDASHSVLLADYDVIIYPNPVTDNKFYVKSEKVIKSVEVINVLGQNIKTVNNETDVAYNIFVELANAQKGMYMVKITFDDKKTVIRKLIVK
jgi:hypothetical protein